MIWQSIISVHLFKEKRREEKRNETFKRRKKDLEKEGVEEK